MTGRETGENPAPDRCGRCGWIDELLDDEGGEGSTDRRAFEEGMKAAARLGRAVSDLEDPARRNDERMVEVIDATAAFYAQFVHVSVNYEMRIALLETAEDPATGRGPPRCGTTAGRSSTSSTTKWRTT